MRYIVEYHEPVVDSWIELGRFASWYSAQDYIDFLTEDDFNLSRVTCRDCYRDYRIVEEKA